MKTIIVEGGKKSINSTNTNNENVKVPYEEIPRPCPFSINISQMGLPLSRNYKRLSNREVYTYCLPRQLN